MNLQAMLPPVHNERLAAESFECELPIAAELDCFAGHFPGEPIVPGVVQVGWAVHLAEKLGLKTSDFAGIPRAKFSAIIVPGTRLRLSLLRKSSAVDFRFESAAGLHSMGTIRYAE